MASGLSAIRDAAREYVTALEIRREARSALEDARDFDAPGTAVQRCELLESQTNYRRAVSRVRKALARIERLLAIEGRVVRIEKEAPRE